MKKTPTISKKKNPTLKNTSGILQESIAEYRPLKKLPSLKEFTYNEFKKIAENSPFTQAEWAGILHVSERTLQRYAKSNGSFAPINAERALQVFKVLEAGKITFGKVENFYNWLKRNPYMLEGNLTINSLSTYEGIQNVLVQLSRIQHGLFA
ncbi:MAG: antitoxin Xre-like helix-turn-helix domain-containing protein [Ferruginibacter sp.]